MYTIIIIIIIIIIIFRKNGFPLTIINKCVKEFLQKRLTLKQPLDTVAKMEVTIILPYLGTNSLRLRSKLIKTFKTNVRLGNLKVIFRSACRMNSFFRFKDKIPLDYMSQLVYQFTCHTCNRVYIGKTPRHYVVRLGEHLAISPFTGKTVDRSTQTPTAVEKHSVETGHRNYADSFRVLAFAPRSRYDVKLRTQESILIRKHDPILNGQVTSIPLVLF